MYFQVEPSEKIIFQSKKLGEEAVSTNLNIKNITKEKIYFKVGWTRMIYSAKFCMMPFLRTKVLQKLLLAMRELHCISSTPSCNMKINDSMTFSVQEIMIFRVCCRSSALRTKCSESDLQSGCSSQAATAKLCAHSIPAKAFRNPANTTSPSTNRKSPTRRRLDWNREKKDLSDACIPDSQT